MTTSQKNVLQYVKSSPRAKTPERKSAGAAGYDVYSVESCSIKPNSVKKVCIGLKIKPPHGTYLRIAPRSGLAANHNIAIGGGCVDEDYNEVIFVLIFNHHQKNTFHIKPGDRIAQIVVEKYCTPIFKKCTSLPKTKRGGKGFGSTGI